MNDRTTAGALLGLYAQTPLHPGSGHALDVVDLPVQREKHTHWPSIAGSAVKGVLRDAMREKIRGTGDRADADKHADLTTLFGPPTAQSSDFGGALAVTDARILAFPVRSLKGVFAWTTCHAVLERFARDARLAGLTGVPTDIPSVRPNESAGHPNSPCWIDDGGKRVILEEFDYVRAAGDFDTTGLATFMANTALPAGDAYKAARERFAKHLVILSDDDFTHFVRYATEVTARIRLDYDTKTVADGALFYQEFLPAETVLYSVLLANPSRNGKKADTAAQVLESAKRHVPAILQIGGDESTGKGFCATNVRVGG